MAAVSGVFAMIGTSRDAAGLDDTAPTLPAHVASSAQPGLLVLDFDADGILAGELNPASAPFATIDDVRLPLNFNDGYHALDADRPVFEWLTQDISLRLAAGGPCSNWRISSYAVSARFGTFDLAGNFSGWVDIPDIEVPSRDERVNYGSVSSDFVNERPSPPEQDAGCSVAVARSNVSPSTDSSSRTLALLCFLVALGLARRALFVERPRCVKSDVRSRPR